MRMCDENDGWSDFTIYVNGVSVGGYKTDDPNSKSEYCNSETTVYKKVASGVRVEDGDTITIKCTTPQDGEQCRLHEVFFGAGSGESDTITTPEVNPFNPSVNVPLTWISENATRCGGTGDKHFAYPNSGAPSYDWLTTNKVNSTVIGTNYTSGIITTKLSTSTVFKLSCSRLADTQTDESNIQISVPFNTALEVETAVGTGECTDTDGSLSGTPGDTITSPRGYGPDENTNNCTLLVNLSTSDPSAGVIGTIADGVNGTYDNVTVIMRIKNFGPYRLPPLSNITYKSTLEFMTNFGLPTTDSPINEYAGLISKPGITEPTYSTPLTQTFDNVPFGNHKICSMVNLDGLPNFPEIVPDPEDNTKCTYFTLPVPEPPMTISVDRRFVRREQPVTLNWSVHTNYSISCEVIGPGGIHDEFDPSSILGNAYTNLQSSAPITSTSDYFLQCTEPITNTTFIKKIRVEVVPDQMEL
jgi:hypothetical protein